MRLLQKSLAAGLAIAIAGTLAPANASTCRPHHVRHTQVSAHVSVVTQWRAPVYRAASVRPYDFYVPTRVVRCYPARAVVQDQVGFTAAIVPLGRCG
jgi:hypothetical protein